MTASHTVRALTWAMAVGVPLLTACDRRETVTPPVAMSSSEAGGSGLVMGTEHTAGLEGGASAPGATSNTTLPNGRLDEALASPAAGTNSLKPLSEAEQRFVRQALESGLYEVAVAALAADRAQSDATKRMAEQLLNDHGSANDKLRQIANGRMEVPTDIPADKQASIDKLSQAKGTSFDKQFVEMVGIRDHQKDIQLFESMQKNAKDAELKLFVQNTLPTLKHHLSTAQDLRSSSNKAND